MVKYNNGNTTYGVQNQTFFLRTALKAVDENFSFAKFADRREMMKQKSGNEFRVPVYYYGITRDVVDSNGTYNPAANGYMAERNASDVQTQLNNLFLTQEGTTTGITEIPSLRKVTFKTTFKKIAGISYLTEDAETYSEDSIRTLEVENLSVDMNQRYDDLIQMDLLSSTFRVYGGTATSRGELGGSDDAQAAKYSLSKKLLSKLYTVLIKNRAKPIASMITGTTRIGSKPIPAGFYIGVGADLAGALRDDSLFPDFIPVEQYPDQSNIFKMEGAEEIGTLGNFRIIYIEKMVNYGNTGALVGGNGDNPSDTCKSGDDGTGKYRYTVYPFITITRDAFATVGLICKNKFNIFTRWPDQIDSGNPIGEKGYVAYKFRYASVITRPEALAVGEVVCPI